MFFGGFQGFQGLGIGDGLHRAASTPHVSVEFRVLGEGELWPGLP